MNDYGVEYEKIFQIIISCTLILTLIAPGIHARIGQQLPGVGTDDETIMVTSMVDAQLNLSSPSAVLLEGSTGTIIYEKIKMRD